MKMESPTIEVRAYRIPDACRLLSVSRSLLYAMRAKGALRFTKIGNRTLISASEIERLLNDRRAA